jgi:hypothetical protein
VILTARLTRLYERRDWQERFAATKNVGPLLLERGITLDLKPVNPPEPAPTGKPGPDRAMMEHAFARVQEMGSVATPFTDIARMREAHQARVAAAKGKQDGIDKEQDGERDWPPHPAAQSRRAAHAGSVDRGVDRRTGVRRAD